MFNAGMILRSISKVFPILIMALVGCATPIEVKTASKAQLSVIAALDAAIADLQQGFDQFHNDKESRIRDEGRMLVARQAIATLYPEDRSMKQITADALFDSYNAKVRPWIDNALGAGGDIDNQITLLTRRINDTSNPLLKDQWTLELQDLQLKRAALRNKPKAVAEIEEVIVGDLNRERQTAQDVSQLLHNLRSQIAVMRSIAAKVDAWLVLDVSVSQEQADSLRKAFVAAGEQLAVGGK